MDYLSEAGADGFKDYLQAMELFNAFELPENEPSMLIPILCHSGKRSETMRPSCGKKCKWSKSAGRKPITKQDGGNVDITITRHQVDNFETIPESIPDEFKDAIELFRSVIAEDDASIIEEGGKSNRT